MGVSWYAAGLRFHCLRCGLCCTGPEGYVWVTPGEIARIAAFRGESEADFIRDHCRQVDGRLSLLEKPGGDCVMFDRASGCAIYDVRPSQCRTWPFWPVNLASPSAWRDAGTRCPGIGAGDRVPAEQISASAARSAGLS
jgi:Fe-S-cluster containining protein